MPLRTRRLGAASLALAALAGFTVSLLSAQPAAAADPLRTLAAAKGKFIGTAVATSPLANETAYRTIAAQEFNQVTAENAMKWDSTEPNDNQYTFSGADQIVAFAQANNQIVHGHTLVWHQQTPGWVQSLSASAMKTAMLDHIATVVGHYANNPAVQSWDVVNEVFDENGGFRTSFWYNTLGSGFIADAFRAARAADPDAKLCINDYNVEGINAKSTAMYNLVSSLKSQGVPIDCVGFQSHLATQYGFPGQLTENVARFAALGVQVRFTELDVRIVLPADTTEINTQNQYYTNIINACLASTACPGVTIWGFTDKYSWVPDTFPSEGQALIYDANYNAKADYTAIATALGAGTGGGDTTAPSAPTNLTASGTTSSGTTLSWTASTDNTAVTGYDILRAPGASGGTFAVVGTSTSTSYADSGLAASSTYRYQVRARDAAGNVSAVSSTVSVTTLSGGGGPGGCSAVGTTQTQWPGGYVIQPVTVTNTGSAQITSWTVTFTLPAGHTITGSWNAVLTVSGQTVTAKNANYNGTLGAGASTSFGFQVARPTSDTALPSGYACAAP
ncbi:MAG: cellulase family glycosylhydrolase [Hamadaea sp.]|nr:cellulase family glycosylhydrolase [Hamadaea sp.]NUR47831.1 cellulase family glycosylhydrolase [Hamadaea sp.]NUT05695.1 cellulase family glycosylhydrolase [Hamadaea sp.]